MKIKENRVFLVAVGLTVAEMAIHGLQEIVNPLSISLKPTGGDSTYIWVCKGEGKAILNLVHLCYGAFILALGVVVANRSAALTTLFNEGKYIVFSIYTCAILCCLIVPASFAVSGDPQVLYILTVMGLVMAVIGTCSAINGPKIALIRSGVDIALTDDGNKTSTAGSTKTSSTAAGTKGTGAAPPGAAIVVKNHVPTALLDKMQATYDALQKVIDRQKQGFALIKKDIDAAMDAVRDLNNDFNRTTFGDPKVAQTSPPGGAAGGKVVPSA
jgi:hypothetical protein